MLVADTSLSDRRVARELVEVIAERGMPKTKVSDNGTEFTSMVTPNGFKRLTLTRRHGDDYNRDKGWQFERQSLHFRKRHLPSFIGYGHHPLRWLKASQHLRTGSQRWVKCNLLRNNNIV